MKKKYESLEKFMREQHGANAIEYGLLAALIAIAIIVGAAAAGTNLNEFFTNVGTLVQKYADAAK